MSVMKCLILVLHQESGSEYPDFPAQVGLDPVVLSLFIPFTSTTRGQGEAENLSTLPCPPLSQCQLPQRPTHVALWWREGLSHQIPVMGPFFGLAGA